VTIIAAWFAVNGLFLLWIWSRYMSVNTVRGFVAHCVRVKHKYDVRTELLIPYGLFVVNTEEQIYNTANTVFDMAIMEFPPSEGWNITVLSSDEAMYMNTIKNMKEAIC
jgi:hypothetical protein